MDQAKTSPNLYHDPHARAVVHSVHGYRSRSGRGRFLERIGLQSDRTCLTASKTISRSKRSETMESIVCVMTDPPPKVNPKANPEWMPGHCGCVLGDEQSLFLDLAAVV